MMGGKNFKPYKSQAVTQHNEWDDDKNKKEENKNRTSKNYEESIDSQKPLLLDSKE